MIESSSSLREHGTENMTFSTPTKSRVRALGNEENQENIMINSCDQMIMSTPNKSTPSKRESGMEAPSTVSARREWLRDFGKKHVTHYHSGNSHITRPSESINAPSSATKKPRPQAPSHHANNMSTAPTSAPSSEPVKRRFTPRKKKVQHSGTEATDDGRASVAKLSQWLANDPTTTKKAAGTVRRGRNISYKSRKFERGQASVIVKENHIERGSVSNKKNWLKNAFHNTEEEEPVDELTSRLNAQYAKSEVGAYDPSATRYARSEIVTSRPSSMSVATKKDWLRTAFKSAADTANDDQAHVEEARSVIITDDAASSLSVSDKKSWLQNAFKNNNSRTGASHGHPTRAATDIMHSRGESRDEVAARAKSRFRQRSNRRLGTPSKSTPSKSTPSKRKGAPEGVAPIEENSVEFKNHKIESNEGASAVPSMKRSSIVELPKKNAVVVEEDRTPVDFRAARQAILERSRKNGNDVEVKNKVYFKKSKYDEAERETKEESMLFEF